MRHATAYVRHAEATHGQAYLTVWSSLRNSNGNPRPNACAYHWAC